jgi:hypothetical protein
MATDHVSQQHWAACALGVPIEEGKQVVTPQLRSSFDKYVVDQFSPSGDQVFRLCTNVH